MKPSLVMTTIKTLESARRRARIMTPSEAESAMTPARVAFQALRSGIWQDNDARLLMSAMNLCEALIDMGHVDEAVSFPALLRSAQGALEVLYLRRSKTRTLYASEINALTDGLEMLQAYVEGLPIGVLDDAQDRVRRVIAGMGPKVQKLH